MTAAESILVKRPADPPGFASNHADTDYLMRARGWVRFGASISRTDAALMAADLDRLYDHCRHVQTRNGVASGMEGAAHHLVGYGSSLDLLLDRFPLHEEIERYFDGKYVIGTFGGALNPPGSSSYVSKPHRDIRAFTSGYRMSLNMLIMLDDFTEENGATLLLDGSHHVETPPEPDLFYRHARPAIGGKGDVLLFDSLLVHAAAANRTRSRRRALDDHPDPTLDEGADRFPALPFGRCAGGAVALGAPTPWLQCASGRQPRGLLSAAGAVGLQGRSAVRRRWR